MPETTQQKDTFEDYWNLGTDRSLPKLHRKYADDIPKGQKVSPSLPTLKSWSKKYNWQERIMLRNKDIARGTESKTIREEIDIRAEAISDMREYLKYLKVAAASAFVKGEDGKTRLRDEVKIRNTDQLARTVSAIFRGEDTLQRLIEPEETMNIQGAIKMEYESIPPELAKRLGDELAQRKNRETASADT
jgi:hypothetical protein